MPLATVARTAHSASATWPSGAATPSAAPQFPAPQPPARLPLAAPHAQPLPVTQGTTGLRRAPRRRQHLRHCPSSAHRRPRHRRCRGLGSRVAQTRPSRLPSGRFLCNRRGVHGVRSVASTRTTCMARRPHTRLPPASAAARRTRATCGQAGPCTRHTWRTEHATAPCCSPFYAAPHDTVSCRSAQLSPAAAQRTCADTSART